MTSKSKQLSALVNRTIVADTEDWRELATLAQVSPNDLEVGLEFFDADDQKDLKNCLREYEQELEQETNVWIRKLHGRKRAPTAEQFRAYFRSIPISLHRQASLAAAVEFLRQQGLAHLSRVLQSRDSESAEGLLASSGEWKTVGGSAGDRGRLVDHFVVYKSPTDHGLFVAHSVRTDQIGIDDSVTGAVRELFRALRILREEALEDPTLIFEHPAPREVVDLFLMSPRLPREVEGSIYEHLKKQLTKGEDYWELDIDGSEGAESADASRSDSFWQMMTAEFLAS